MIASDFFAYYAKLTGHQLKPVPFAWESDTYLFLKLFDADELRVVVRHIQKRYADKPDIVASMTRWVYLIRQTDTFAGLLAEANAMNRPRHTERDKVLLASGRPAASKPERPARPAGEVLRRMSKDRLSEGWKGILRELDKPTL